ncbi:MAG: glycosyltransferase family 39 protein [Cyanobacteria bacterium P01_G01_bin.19]
MSPHRTSIWRRSPNKLRRSEIWLECFYFTSLLLAALILFLVNLGSLPLLDLDEGTNAQVAKQIFLQGSFSGWIFPTLWNEPYFAQPPLVHGLIAIAYKVFGINEFATRLPGALLGAASVVLLYNIGREVFVARFPAVCGALIYLTCLPVVRSSRLAMSDGPLLCFELIAVWAMLRSRRDLRWSLLVGIGLGMVSLTQGAAALPVWIVIGSFLLWDTPRLLTSSYFIGGLLLGALPGIGWYVAQYFHYYELDNLLALFELFMGQMSNGEAEAVAFSANHLIRGLTYIFPWGLAIFFGSRLALQNIHWGWGRLFVVWIGVYFTLFLLTYNHDFWSISFLSLYPVFALAGGIKLDSIRNLPSYIDYPRIWTYSFILMAVIAAIAGLHWGIRNYSDFYLPFICGSFAITFTATAIVMAQQEQQFIPLLFWGLLVSIFMLLISPHWIWELRSVEPVKPIASLIREHTPKNQVVYTSMSRDRPSLDFYSDRRVVPLKLVDLKIHWEADPKHDLDVYLLVDSIAIDNLDISAKNIISTPSSEHQSSDWMLAVKHSQSQS